MPRQIPFRNGRLDYSGAPAFNSRTITIQDNVLMVAFNGAVGALLPSSYPSPNAVQTVPITSIITDFSQRIVDYDTQRLISIIQGIQSGVNLPPLSVFAQQNGTYTLQNGYHRLLACALLGFQSVPVDQPPAQQQVVAVPVMGKYIPPHLRQKK